MAWNVVQSAKTASAGDNNPSTVAATYGSNVTSGNKLVAVIGMAAAVSTTITSVTFGTGNNGTQCGFLVDPTTDQVGIALYAMDVPAGVGGTAPVVTVTFNSTLKPSAASLWIGEVSGLATGNTTAAMLDGTAATAAFAAASSDAQPSYSSAASNEWLVSCGGDNGGPQTVTQPNGYTLDSNSVTDNSFADAFIAWKNSTGGAESGTWSFGGTTTGTALLVVAFKVASSPPPVSSGPAYTAFMSSM